MKERICLTSAIAAVAALALLARPRAPATCSAATRSPRPRPWIATSRVRTGRSTGLFIGADNVRLKLNGFTVSYTGLAGGGVAGIASASPDEDGLQNVEIKRGSVEGFQTGIDLPDP